MKVIVSGFSGNLGKQLLKIAKYEIIPIGRNDWEELETGDLSGCDCFVHLAYDLNNTISDNPDKVLDSNILATAKALKICGQNNIKKFIFLSSCSVYGHSSKTSESINCSPETINGMSKYLCEKVIFEYCNANKIKPLILRAFNSYGGDDKFSVISKLINSYKNRKPFLLFNDGLAERDFIHISDVAKVVDFYINNASRFEILNIGTGRSVKIIEVVNAFQKKFGKVEIINKINNDEVVYSRADLSKIEKEFKGDYIQVLDYLEKCDLNKIFLESN